MNSTHVLMFAKAFIFQTPFLFLILIIILSMDIMSIACNIPDIFQALGFDNVFKRHVIASPVDWLGR